LKRRGTEDAEEIGLNEISGRIINCALKVHSAIGPGVLESVYQTCLLHELQKAGLSVQSQVALPVVYGNLRLDSGYRLDLLVADTVIVGLKCVEALLPIHKAQLLTYLRLANKPLGLLLNFNVVHLREGIKRVLNNKYQMGIAASQR
jgi:GxxExxY protein